MQDTGKAVVSPTQGMHQQESCGRRKKKEIGGDAGPKR